MVASSFFAAAGLLAAAGANAVYVITNPVTGQTLYQNDSIAFNWTADAASDPQHFRILIRNTNNPGLLPVNDNPHELANQVVTTDQYLAIQLGNVQVGEDFTIEFVNTTNTSQIFAEVEKIKVEKGIPSTSSLPVSQSTSKAPNAFASTGAATTTAATANPFSSASASATAKSAAMRAAPAVAGVLAVVAAALVL